MPFDKLNASRYSSALVASDKVIAKGGFGELYSHSKFGHHVL